MRQHPNVYISSPKEPYYFSTDLNIRSWSSEKEYLSTCFSGCLNKHLAVGEATAWYLFSTDAVPKIIDFNSKAKFVVMIRNPLDMFCSLHSQMLYERNENISDAATAWHMQELRSKERCIPSFCKESKFLNYGKACKLGMQLKRLYDLIPKESIKVIVFDDFVTQTPDVYKDVLGFLKLPIYDDIRFGVYNRSKKVRSQFIADLLVMAQLNPLVMNVFKAAKQMLGIHKLGLTQFNTKYHKRPPVPKEFSAELSKYFSQDIKTLSALIGRDLSHWINNI